MKPRIPGSRSGHERLVRACLTYLATVLGLPTWRLNQRPVLTTKGWRNPGADAGCPDLISLLPGIALGVECKSGGGTLSADQREARGRWEAAGHWWITARNAKDDLEPVADYMKEMRRPGGPLAQSPVALLITRR